MPISPIPSVMISGWTRKMPTPMPLARPISIPGTMRDEHRRSQARASAIWVATMKALIVATVPTERSMPPVSIVMVWQPARMASGIANLIVLAIQRSLTMPGRRNSSATTSRMKRTISGTIG